MHIESKSNHFVVFCPKYPEFSFVSQDLRKYRVQRDYGGRDEHKKASGVVTFHQHLLDSKALRFDEEEARIVYEDLKARKSAPLWGTHLVEPGQPVLGERSDGQFGCQCQKRFDTMEALQLHYKEKHEPKKGAA